MTALIKFITNEWYFFLPMLLMSLVAAALVVWRWLLNLNARTNLEDFLPVFQDKLQREGVESALKYCRSQSGRHPTEALRGRAGELPPGPVGHEAGHGQRHRAGDPPRPELPARPDPGHRQGRHHGRPVPDRRVDDQHVHRHLGGGQERRPAAT